MLLCHQLERMRHPKAPAAEAWAESAQKALDRRLSGATIPTKQIQGAEGAAQLISTCNYE